MTVLILYANDQWRQRQTVRDHLYSFRRYSHDCRFIYLNAAKPWRLFKQLGTLQFDAIILHYTFLALRFSHGWQRDSEVFLQKIASLPGKKVLIAHDEYSETQALWKTARVCNASIIYTSCPPRDYPSVFPAEQLPSDTQIKTVFTGYVDDKSLKKLDKRAIPLALRPLDIGYRALESSFLFGVHGQTKTQLAQEVLTASRALGFKTDIRLTYNGDVNTLKGRYWLRFLASCVASPGCLGGSSLLDTDGAVKKRVLAYRVAHPSASFEEVARECYKGADGTIQAFLLGPRHFECAMTRTCQLLVEGDYQGVFLPGIHYIEIKKNYSNLPEVLHKVKDRAYCQEVADRCHRDIAASGKYSYSRFVSDIIHSLRQERVNEVPPQTGRAFMVRFIAAVLNRIPTVKTLKSLPYHWYCALKIYRANASTRTVTKAKQAK